MIDLMLAHIAKDKVEGAKDKVEDAVDAVKDKLHNN